MNNYTKDLALDIGKRYLLAPVYAKQGDMASRYLTITLMNGDAQYKPASGNTAKFRALKPDGNSVMNTATINSDGTVTCELTAQTLACAGIVKADVVILDGNSKALASTSFDIAVERAPIGENIESKDEFKEILELIDEASAAVSAANTAANSATTAATQALAAKASAEEATQNANTAATQALAAKASAEEAAQKANTAAETVAAIDDTVVSTTAWSSKHIVDMLCPEINETGNPVQCYPLEGYPLTATASWEPTQEGSGDPSPENVRPITGRDSVQIQACGENILPNFSKSETVNGVTWTVDNGSISATGTATKNSALRLTNDAIAALNLTLQALKGKKISAILPTGIGLALFDKNWTGATFTNSTRTITVPANVGEVINAYFQVLAGETVNISDGVAAVTIGTTAPTSYTPYTGATKTLTLPETIYGGSVANDGAGTNEWALITLGQTSGLEEDTATIQSKFCYRMKLASTNETAGLISNQLKTIAVWGTLTDYSLEWQKGNYMNCVVYIPNMSTKQDYLDYFSANNVQIAYKLANPTTFTATGGGELTGLDGLNNVLTDADSVTVEGREDIKHTIKELQDALASITETEA